MYAELQGKIYANDPYFDNLQARLVRRSCIVGETLDGWIVEHTVEVLDFGKPPSVAVDPDATMRVEGPAGIGDPVFAKQAKTERLRGCMARAAGRAAHDRHANRTLP